MFALFVSTSTMSWSTWTESPACPRTLTMVASAMDSPNCGMMMGIWGIPADLGFTIYDLALCAHGPHCPAVSRSQQFSGSRGDVPGGWTMGGPEVRMIRHRGVFGVEALRRC